MFKVGTGHKYLLSRAYAQKKRKKKEKHEQIKIFLSNINVHKSMWKYNGNMF